MNLVIDGNSFLNVAVNIVKQMMYNDRTLGQNYWVEDLMSDGFILKDGAKSLFRDFSLKYLHSIVSMHTDLEHVFIPFDSKSWRKEFLETASDSREVDYKGQRKYDDKQPLFYEYFRTDILTAIEAANIAQYRVPGAEGDDIVTRLIERYPESDFCIWSTDLDFFQLLTNKPRLVMLSTPKMSRKTKNVYTAKGYEQKQQESGFNMFDFSFAGNVDHILEFTRKGHLHTEVDPREELIAKLLAGDKSDNIPRVHPSMTPKKVETILNVALEEFPTFIETLDTDPASIVRYFEKAVAQLLKITDEKMIADIKSALVVNIRIIRLNSKFLPKEILKTIDYAISTTDLKPFQVSELKKLVRY